MSQDLLSTEGALPYALIQTYQIIRNEANLLRYVVQRLLDAFGSKILIAVGKQLHQLLTGEPMIDIPEIQKHIPVAKTQADLLIYIQLQNPVCCEKITIRRIINKVFRLINSKQLFSSAVDFNDYAHILNNRKNTGYTDVNDNCYVYHIQYFCNYVDQLKVGRKNTFYTNENDMYSHMHHLQPLNEAYRHIVQNLSDVQQGVNVLGFGSTLFDIAEALKNIYGLNDEYYDRYFQTYCSMVECGYYYCLNKEQLQFHNLDFSIEETRFLEGEYLRYDVVPVKKVWPQKEDDDEPVEEEVEELEGQEEKQEEKEELVEEEIEERQEPYEAEEQQQEEKSIEDGKESVPEEREELDQKDQRAEGGEGTEERDESDKRGQQGEEKYEHEGHFLSARKEVEHHIDAIHDVEIESIE